MVYAYTSHINQPNAALIQLLKEIYFSQPDVWQRTESDLVSVRHAADDSGEAAAVLDFNRSRHFRSRLSDDGHSILGSHLDGPRR